MRWLAFILAVLASLVVQASDYVREKKWAEEVLPAVLVGEPVWLEGEKGHKFLGLFAEADKPRAAVILVHGIGVHPDWGLISQLRQQLPEAGYTTLSVQMPVLAADARPEAYPPTFPEAAERLRRAVAWLKGKGYRKVAIVSHSLGCRMSYAYLQAAGKGEVAAWVAVSTPGTEDWSGLKLPILDLYGANDLPQVLKNAGRRAKALRQPGSRQVQVAGADHFFEGRDPELLGQVRGFLDHTL